MPKPGELSRAMALALAAVAPRAPAEELAPRAPQPATAAERDAFLAAWARKLETVKSLEITFRQEKRLKVLRSPRLSQGELAYREGKLRVTVRGKDGEVESEILMRDGELKIHYPRLARLEVLELGREPAGAGPALAIPFFAADPRELGKTHKVTLERGAAADKLILAPKDAKSPVKRVELVLVGHEVREYRQVDASGDEVRMEVLTARVNGELAAQRFELKVPPETKVVRLGGGGSGAPADKEPRR